jgi:hypothetical protein
LPDDEVVMRRRIQGEHYESSGVATNEKEAVYSSMTSVGEHA